VCVVVVSVVVVVCVVVVSVVVVVCVVVVNVVDVVVCVVVVVVLGLFSLSQTHVEFLCACFLIPRFPTPCFLSAKGRVCMCACVQVCMCACVCMHIYI